MHSSTHDTQETSANRAPETDVAAASQGESATREPNSKSVEVSSKPKMPLPILNFKEASLMLEINHALDTARIAQEQDVTGRVQEPITPRRQGTLRTPQSPSGSQVRRKRASSMLCSGAS